MGCNNNKCNKMDFPKMTKEQKDAFYQKVFSGENKNHFVDKPDRFVLEEDISRQEDINDHLNLLIEDILDNTISSGYVDADDIVNTLQGIINIHELRTHKLWEHFKIIFELDEHAPCNSQKKSYNPDRKVDPFDPFKE
jgi:hypothetical protein